MWSNSQSLPRSPEHRDVSSPKRQMKVSVESISYFLSESDLNANADHPSSDLPYSWSSAVRMDTSTPLHQHPEVVCSNLTVLKLRHVPVKPAEKQKFSDGHWLPKRRGVRSLKHMMEVSLKDISYLSCEPDLNANVDHSSSLLPHSESREAPRSKLPILKPKRVPVKPVNQQSFTDEPSEWLGVDSNHIMKGSQSVRMDKRRLLRQHNNAPRSKLPILKPKRVHVKPVNQQSFTDEPSEWLSVASNHMMKGSQSVRMDKRRPLRQHPDSPRSKLPILKPKRISVKPVNQQSFTDEPSEWLDMDSNHTMKGSQSVRMDKRRLLRQHNNAPRSKLPILKPKRVHVKPVNQQSFTDEPSEWLGVASNHMMKGSQSVRMDKRRPLRQHPDSPRSKLPILKPKGISVKPVNQQSFTDEPSEWLDMDSNHTMKGSQSVRMDKRRPLRQHPDAPRSKPPILKPNHVPVKPVNQQCFTDEPSEWLDVGSCEHQMEVSLKDPPCEFDLNVRVECSSTLLMVRVGKSQHTAAVSTHLPSLRPRCAPVKLLAGQKFIDEAPERQVCRFPPLVNKAERNGTDPSFGSDWKVKSHLSLPSLPRLTSGVKMDKHVPLHVPSSTTLPALKPAHGPVKPALPSNLMFFPFNNEDVKMKRARSRKRSPLLLSRFHSATYF